MLKINGSQKIAILYSVSPAIKKFTKYWASWFIKYLRNVSALETIKDSRRNNKIKKKK